MLAAFLWFGWIGVPLVIVFSDYRSIILWVSNSENSLPLDLRISNANKFASITNRFPSLIYSFGSLSDLVSNKLFYIHS